MVLPIVAYGHPVLRKKCEDITPDYPGLSELIQNMWETLYASNGVGLAAPQVNVPIRLFLVDSKQMTDHFDEEERLLFGDEQGIKQVFINARILEVNGEEWPYNEGCLSIPKIREDILRPQTLKIRYVDEHFQPHEETYSGLTARVIFHEYDHIEGKLFIDYLKPLKKKLLRKKLDDIAKGKVEVNYKMIFAKV
ncbi:peptide deformylase [Thermoflavifilum thermophilum]|uniref:Peptide deformylase n=1 Tax=Thermoflavifilum thermophilum TaxID=1393122 RepID=A0A1I7NGS3_9BACT|nr:peptide deformylase [Thermoflavifilum thermophilum]SFV33756.1 peptide deformylase [Thermoflavifilum thermophilum]